jgi:hypothetical protein
MAKLRKDRVVALSLAACGVGIVILALVLFRGPLVALLRRGEPADRPLPVSSGPLAGQGVKIAAGEIPVPAFLRFLSEYTGMLVIHDSSDKRIEDAKLRIPAPINNVNAEVVRAILAAHGFRVFADKLADGREVLRVEVRQSREP